MKIELIKTVIPFQRVLEQINTLILIDSALNISYFYASWRYKSRRYF